MKRPLVIFDASVLMHMIINLKRDENNNLLEYLSDDEMYHRLQAGVNAYNTLFFLIGAKPCDYDILWVGDSTNGYWRTDWFKQWLEERPEFLAELMKGFDEDGNPTGRKKTLRIGYKAGRVVSPYTTKAKYWTNQVSNAFVVPDYEADDVAAAVVKLNPDRKILLVTIDTDWLQLVDENVHWVCAYGHNPQYRDIEGGMEWFRWAIAKASSKVKAEFSNLESLRQIVDWKMFAGDVSDNLPKGSPREMIDLFYPPEEHRLWLNPFFRKAHKKSVKRGMKPLTALRTLDRVIDSGYLPPTPRVTL